ncbi:MAG: ABC transporter permease [Chloroflexi bacterium]|nr:ABC transporter permease [Chloroflexota bacterium]
MTRTPTPAPTPRPDADGRSNRAVWLRRIQGQGLVLVLLLLIVIFTSQSKYFLTSQNFFSIGSAATALGIMAVAQTFLIISGGFDLSVGSVVALTGVVIGVLFQNGTGLDIWLSALVGLSMGLLVGIVNGAIVVGLKINALITTLGTLSIFSGLAYLLTAGKTLIITSPSFQFLGSGYIGPVPVSMIIFGVVAGAGIFVARYTGLGRAIFAIGGNPEAARLSGIEVSKVQFGLYVTSGLLAGLAGVLITAQLGASSPQVGSTYTLSVVTAVILRGTSLAGGRGSVVGTVLAVVILTVLQNGFALLQLSSFVQTMALGIVLILAVLLDETVRRLDR